ncbi:MAG: DUF4105 domain-containing protein [Paludibacteraceae bacterium]|nr:DUF4105 domain-containing protein [Paludibacteraceae bacterium]
MRTSLLKGLILSICIICGISTTYAEEQRLLSDSATVSLLTCSPGTEIYELFGHSGIRVFDKEKNIDVTFNYGLFDFNQDDFIYRFVRGKTDYEVGVTSTDYFLHTYIERGSGVMESVLNLTQSEKESIWLYLMENIQPENKTYRYNFIFNNCATKLRDIFDQNVSGVKSYPDVSGSLSFREAVGLYTKTSPWSQFGVDICLGRGMDRDATTYEKMFLPEILGNTINQSTVMVGDSTFNLVSQINTINENTLENPAPFISPLALGIILCVLVLILSLYGLWKKLDLRWFDAIIFSINGLFGCLVLFLILFSKHPFTFANFNIIWLNPLFFCPLLFVIFKRLQKYEFIYYAIVSIVLVLFLFGSNMLSQEFNDAVYPFTIIFLLRALSYVINWGYRLDAQKEHTLS